MSEIRTLLADAQTAEARGNKTEAGRLLRQAAAYYRERQQLTQAARMLRQARRAEGLPDEDGDTDESVFGFEAPERVLVEQREPQLADASMDAWCSFCCKPKTEVGALVAGPAGSFICASCTAISAKLNGSESNNSPSPATRERVGVRAEWSITQLAHELPAQRRATQRLTRLRSQVTLVIGPVGSGKSAWLKTLGEIEVIDAALTPTLSRERERGSAPVFICVTGEIPPPSLILQGELGPEPLHDTAALASALPKLDAQLLAKVDAVFSFEAPDVDALVGLARALAKERTITVSDEVLTQVAQLAHRSGRGAHELVALLARIPSGNYT